MNFPKMVLIEQEFETARIENVESTMRRELSKVQVQRRLRPGMRIAITAGSRGITGIEKILAALVAECRRYGTEPFLIPAMGSHGGATADGQKQVLDRLGIIERAIGCPIVATMGVVEIGKTDEGIPVVIDQAAARADGIIVVNRIKPHEEFNGDMGSGLMKMMAIGLGKYTGAVRYHRSAVQFGLDTVITSVARVVMRNATILFGLGVLENAYGQTSYITAVEPERLEEVEKELFVRAKELVPSLPFKEIDLLIVDEVGKEISGTGMDARIISRVDVLGQPKPRAPRITRVVALALTDETNGNAAGVGFADYVPQHLVDQIDYTVTYLNCIASITPEEARIPITAKDDRQAIEWALATIGDVKPDSARVVRIKNTSRLERMYISRSLIPELESQPPQPKVLRDPEEMAFDDTGRLVGSYTC